jgi:hypothetical protein
MTALSGTFVSLKTMADGTCRVTLDLDCPISDFVALNGGPGSVWGMARLQDAPAPAKEPEPEKPKGGQLAKWAVLRCKEPEFWSFMADLSGQPVDSEEECKQLLLFMGGIQSRSELDTNKESGDWFKTHIMGRWATSDFNPHNRNLPF